MSILGSAKYKIDAEFIDNTSRSVGCYVDSFDNLRRTIRTTWSKIPHRVVVVGNVVTVYHKTEEKKLAVFTFSPFTQSELPDHF